jgi:hypothetical protein
MKTSRSSNWIRVVFWWLALALVVILLTIPLLAKGISLVTGHPKEPEKLDIRPIPVPVPPPPLASNESLASAAPAPEVSAIALVPAAIVVPTPSVSVQTQAAVAQPSTVELSRASTIQIVNPQGAFVIALALLVLLFGLWFHRAPTLHSLHEECTG